MKHLFPTLLFCLFYSLSPSAWAQVDEQAHVTAVGGAQVGLVAAWVYNEIPFSRTVVTRINAGLEGSLSWGSSYRGTKIALVPVIEAGPRWYYNLDRRFSKQKHTAGNAANYLALPLSYHPGWFVVSNVDGTVAYKGIAAVPTWGLRRKLGDLLTFELGIGVGYGLWWKDNGSTDHGVYVQVPLRFGF